MNEPVISDAVKGALLAFSLASLTGDEALKETKNRLVSVIRDEALSESLDRLSAIREKCATENGWAIADECYKAIRNLRG